MRSTLEVVLDFLHSMAWPVVVVVVSIVFRTAVVDLLRRASSLHVTGLGLEGRIEAVREFEQAANRVATGLGSNSLEASEAAEDVAVSRSMASQDEVNLRVIQEMLEHSARLGWRLGRAGDARPPKPGLALDGSGNWRVTGDVERKAPFDLT